MIKFRNGLLGKLEKACALLSRARLTRIEIPVLFSGRCPVWIKVHNPTSIAVQRDFFPMAEFPAAPPDYTRVPSLAVATCPPDLVLISATMLNGKNKAGTTMPSTTGRPADVP